MGQNNFDNTNIAYLFVLGVKYYFYCLRSPNITPYRRGSLHHRHQLFDDSTSSGKRRKVLRFKELEENTAVHKRDRQRELKYNTNDPSATRTRDWRW